MTDHRITDEMVEAAAQSIWRNNGDAFYPTWEEAISESKDVFRALARAALSAAIPLMEGEALIKIEGDPDTSKAPWDGMDTLLYGHGEYDVGFYSSGDWRVGLDHEPLKAYTHYAPLPHRPKEG